MGCNVYIIGVGPGREDLILPMAKEKIEEADCLIGARRHLSSFSYLNKEELIIEGHFDGALPYIKRYKDEKRIAILVSGDPGMYSLLEKVSKVLKKQEYGVIPGISTVQLAFARIGEGWYDARIISLHGRRPYYLAQEVAFSYKTFLFTDQDFGPPKIAQYLLRRGLNNRRAIVLENLTYPNERIIDTDLKQLSKMDDFGLCSMIIKKEGKEGEAKLYGIGIGPGDPGLVTLKAKEILNRTKIIFVPKAANSQSFSRSIVEAITQGPKIFIELTFPMTKDNSILKRFWKNASKRIAKEIHKGNDVSFVTIGDPFIYSTYIYLLKTIRKDFPDIDIETVPGISSFSAAAARADIPLSEGRQSLAIIPVTDDLTRLTERLKGFDTVVLMKVGSRLQEVISILKGLGLLDYSVLISRVGLNEEEIIHDLASLKDKEAGYLSVLIVKNPSPSG